MSYTQRFVQLNDYILLSFEYTSPVSPDYLNYSFTRIVNTEMDGVIQLLNTDDATDATGNVQERSALQISSGKYVDLDKDQLPTYINYSESLGNITTSSVTAANTPYDRVRFYLCSGYNFEDKDGIICQIKATERSGKEMQLANTVFLKDSDLFEFVARPIWLGDRLYDRFFEVKIPSIKQINDIFYSLEGSPLQPASLVAKLTSNGLGFLRAQPLTVSVIDIASTDTLRIGGARYKSYNIGSTKTVALNQSDEFALLSAVIQPSPAGDYFEYYGSWAGGFIEDFLLNANSLPGNNYIVLHEIRILEQVGSILTETDVFQTIQETDFDQPKKFRPIIENSDKAVSFTLEYTTRLYNKADSSQIIRTASYTSYNAKAWGKTISKINLLNYPEPYRIYNKVVDGPTLTGTSLFTIPQVSQFNTKYVPSFFDRFNINTTSQSVMLNKDGQLTTEKSTTTKTIYGQGDLNIIINPFDNFFMFTILKTTGTETPIPLDLGTSAHYQMVFINNLQKKMRFEAVSDATLADPSKGDVLFKIPETDAEKITTFDTKEFYIVAKFVDGSETMLFQGMFNKPQDIQTVKAADNALQASQTANVEKKIKEIEEKQTKIAADTEKIKNAAPNDVKTNVNVKVEIPGVSNVIPSGTKNSIVSNIKPASETKKSAATIATDEKLKTQADLKKPSV